MAEPRRKDRPWSEYPIGTKALALMGGHWIKTERGWKWHCGDTFPTPGADAFDVILPAEQQSSPASQTTGGRRG